ncbi:MAG: hypothetical protein Q9217_005286 [Psora testacea]
MSVFGVERSHTNAADFYDHAINLVDSTKPKVDIQENVSEPSGLTSVSRTVSGKGLGHLRKQLARKDYAKWQEEKDPDISAAGSISEGSDPQALQKKPYKTDSSRTEKPGDMVHLSSKKQSPKHDHEQDTFIDVLYENQRGSFFCGIPLYSANSLLNFDPAGWQNAVFQDSLVNITNAQVPDPSWQWAWRTWYVDMSYDVDEEGWQYSFSFGNAFVWHGNHPWFHSFVRRRRWLRKRVRIHPRRSHRKKGNTGEGHMLSPDYFTIHALGRDRSRESSADRTTNTRSSFLGAYNTGNESDEDVGEVADIAALMVALRRARLDREKIAAAKAFLDQGGDELLYLAENMPVIMDDFVHQTSRRQLQTTLLQALDEATKNGQEDENADREAKRRRIDNLFKAVHAAGVHTNDVDFWKDLRGRTTGSEAGPTNETHALDAGEAANVENGDPHTHMDDEGRDLKEEIRGIPDGAEISEEPRIRFDNPRDDSDGHNDGKALDKGKGKA